MTKRYEVLIIQKSASLPDGLRESLQSKGYATRVFGSERDIKRSEIKENNSIVVVYSDSDGSCEQSVVSLSETADLHTFPLIVIGEDADRFESYLNRYFSLATTITTPCNTSDVLAAVEYVIRYSERVRKTQEKEGAKATPVKPTSEADDLQAQALYQGFSSIPGLVFDQIKKLGIMKREIGGARYATALRSEKVEFKPYLPETVGIRQFAEQIKNDLADGRVAHFFRVSMLSDILFTGLQLQGPHKENARMAAALYSASYIFTHRDLSIREYLSINSDVIRKELCSRIKDSAMDLAASGYTPEVSQIVAALARYIGQEETPGDTPVSIAASCIMAADLVDRLIFQNGSFNPVACYCLISKFKNDAVSELHPLVLGCLIKVLAEAVSSNISSLSMPKKIRRITEAKTAAARAKQLPLQHNEAKLSVAELSPGMKLSRPLTTWDGKELINDPVVLDEDMIWRLWQLSSIRPVDGAVVINSEN